MFRHDFAGRGALPLFGDALPFLNSWLVMLMSACSGRNYNFLCINVVFGVFLRESAPTAAKTRTNLSSYRRSCRKPLDLSGLNLTHVCRFIWEWTSAKKINLSSPKGYLEGVRRSHIQKSWKDAKHLDRSGPNLAHICIFIWEWTS